MKPVNEDSGKSHIKSQNRQIYNTTFRNSSMKLGTQACDLSVYYCLFTTKRAARSAILENQAVCLKMDARDWLFPDIWSF